MNIAICDDNPADAQQLALLINGKHAHRIFLSAGELLAEMDEQGTHYDLYLLDIFIGEENGMSLGKRIREMQEHALICYISTSPDYYAEAFSLYAFQYLLKPVTPEAFEQMLTRASEQFLHDSEQCIHLNSRGRYLSIPYGRILYINSMGHTLYIHCKNNVVECLSGRLDEFAGLLDGTVFARCHQSYLINLYNADSLESNFFLCGGEQIPISRRYTSVKERYRQLLFRDME